jgi:tRNA(Arg) A34 adenosine deaminase TadA
VCVCNRRTLLTGAATCLAMPALGATVWTRETFVTAAFKMQWIAIQAGDQPYGAVIAHGVALEKGIAGYGVSRVRELGEQAGHAEREAIRKARENLGTADLAGYVIYSTSRPCRACESAAAEANIARMYYGRDATDAGEPRL